MNLEVFEAATTVEEAVLASHNERRRRFALYVDLKADGVRLNLFRHLPEGELHTLSNQVSVACNDRTGITEKLARRLELVIGLPFGFFDQPLPKREVRASVARGTRLARKLNKYNLSPEWAGRSKSKIAQIMASPTGERGVSKALYQEAIEALRDVKVGSQSDV